VSHTTIMRWVLRYVPGYKRRWARFARSPGSSWRMDETAVSVRGGQHYHYRAVGQAGKSVASLLCNDRSVESAEAFSRAAASQETVPWPEKINVDGNSATHRGLRLLATEDRRWQDVEVRARRYLDNVVEKVGGTGTTTTDTAESGRRFHLGPIRTSRLPGRSHAIARRDGCLRRASIRRSGGASCGVSRARRLRPVAGFPGTGFKPRRRFEIGSKCSLTVTQIRGS